MAALSRPSLRSASRSTEFSATGIQRNSSTRITKNRKRTSDLALFNDDNCFLKKQKTRVQDLSHQVVAQGHDADSLVASADKSPKGVVTQGSTSRNTQLETTQQRVKKAGLNTVDARSTPNGIVHEFDTAVVARKVDKRSLRSQDGGSRSKSELALYFPSYDELVSIEPKETELLTIDTLVHITDEPLKPAASTFHLPRSLIHAPNIQNPDTDHFPAKVNGFPQASEEPEEDLMKLNDAQRIDFSSIDCPKKFLQEDPMTDAVYLKAHRRAERQEKQLRNIEKERAQHEKVQLERLLDGLKGHDWLRVMGISGITDSEKKLYEPKRDYLIQEVESLLDKFRVWKEEEKRRKLEKEQKTEEDDEDMSEASDGEPPDYNDVDAWAARQLHREAGSATGKRIGKSRSHWPQPTDALPLLVEKPFTSFFSKPYLREAALGKHRRGRTRFAFGQPLPDIIEREFEVPSDLLTQDALNTPTGKASGKLEESNMVGLVELPSPQAPGLGFSISHQKVELDIGVLSRSLKGRAEITINPHSRDLKTIRLNCRQCELTSLKVNGKPSSSAPYQDPYNRTTLPWSAGVHQYHMLRQKLESQLKNPPMEELVVNLPKSIRIDELDPLSVDAQNILVTKSLGGLKRDSGDSLASDLAQAPRAVVDQTLRFTPITLVVEYVMKHIREGMHFVGWEDGDLRYPHAYTKNSLSPGAACCLFPCLDDISSRCTWEISIKCARTIGDALEKIPEPRNQIQVNGSNGSSNATNNDHASAVTDRRINFSDEDKALELAVICTGDMTDEIADPLDPAKKTTSFTCMTAVGPQHIGFTIGPFEHVDLAEFRESDEDDKLGQNAIPVHGFCLPGRADELRNTCLPLAKAIDFFTLAYGSYPFYNYKLCFVDDLLPDILHTGSLSICSNRLLFPEDILEPLDRVTRRLVHALATQWMGINIIPKEAVDTWVVVGIAYFITDMFMRKLSGNNEYRYRQKRASDRTSELDVARPSLYDTGPLITLDLSELEFMELKAPLVLFILDRRLTKASGSSGLSRIVSRVFLNAKVGDLANGAVDTNYFMKTCEKLGHAKLDIFFAQWVFGAGCPRFRINQRFNKKKLVVEMLIQQSQGELPERDLERQTFMRDVKEEIHSVYAGPVQPVFTGPMTIRIHEADGTPYEHIIEIKEALTKFEIPYNTKYKRLKRSRRQKERTAAVSGMDYMGDGDNDILLYCLGDVLQSEEEIRDWKLVEWSKEDEDKMSQESYEWIRVDADFEWICKMSIVMPGYMYLSQLQQDRDVVAQLESVQYMAAQKEHPLIATILIRTLMDRRYFHGIRTAAAAALTTHATEKLGWRGQFHLEKAFQQFFCYPDSPMARSNDFSDRTAYNVQCAIVQAVAKVRDGAGRAPMSVVTFLHEKLKFNDNSNNEFSDCHYITSLMISLAEALSSKPISIPDALEMEVDSDDDLRFYNICLDEIDRYRRIDEWIPSYHNILSSTALNCTQRLIKAGVTDFQPADFLQYTRDGTFEDLRLNAFSNLMDLGALKMDPILRWFLFVLGTDPSPYVRDHMLRIFGNALGAIAIGESLESAATTQQDGLIIEQESSTEARRADLARKQTVVGALAALKAEIGTNPVLKQGLWTAITSPTLTLREIAELLEICGLLYTPESSMIVILKYPRYWSCAKTGKATLVFTPTTRIRTTPIPKRLPPPVLKQEDTTSSMPAPRPFLKPPKRPSVVGAGEGGPPEGVEAPKPKLTLKLSLKGAGGRGAGGT